jgi:hypothetical protein
MEKYFETPLLRTDERLLAQNFRDMRPLYPLRTMKVANCEFQEALMRIWLAWFLAFEIYAMRKFSQRS